MKFFLLGKNRRAAVLGLAVFCLFIGACAAPVRDYAVTGTAMGTVVSFKVYGDENVRDLPGELYGNVTALEREVLSPDVPEALLAKMNAEGELVFANADRTEAAIDAGAVIDADAKKSDKEAPEEAVALPKGSIDSDNRALLAQILDESLAICEASDGALDITLGALTLLWGIDKESDSEFLVPSGEAIEEALKHTGYEQIVKKNGTFTLPEGMLVNLGAVAKGAALDLLKNCLEEKEHVKGAVISLGGSVLTFGSKPDDSAWRIGVKDPADDSALLGELVLNGEWYVSTSGDYERFAEVSGVRYHHILDRRIGRPADSGVRSVTILAKEGLVSDALSTACFVLGVEEGMKLVDEYGAEALFVDENGRIYMTEGMKAYFCNI